MTPFFVMFSGLPLGTLFEVPGLGLYRKLGDRKVCRAEHYLGRKLGVRPVAPVYDQDPQEMVLVRERRREDVEDRRLVNDYNGHARRGPDACRANSGRRTGDSMRFITRKQAQDRTVRQDSKAGFEIKVTTSPELAKLLDLGGKMGAIREALTTRYGATHRDSVELVRTLVQDADNSTARNTKLCEDVRRQGELIARLYDDKGLLAREKNALEAEGTRLRDRINELEVEVERQRTHVWELKQALMGRPQGLGPKAFANVGTCPWIFRTESGDPKARTGRTTRMLTAALDGLIAGQKVLVCTTGSGLTPRTLMATAEQMLRERVEGVIANSTTRTLSVKGFPGRARFAILPPPAMVDQIERDLERGDIYVDHFAVEKMFTILTGVDGRSRAMLRLAYPRLAAQLDR